MLRAKIICTNCKWEGYPEERATWVVDYQGKHYEQKEVICPVCSALYFNAPEYLAEIKRLASKHSFGFLFNPGGGEFTSSDHGRCQIGTNNDIDDYKTFLKFLQSKGLEDAGEV